MEKLQQLLGDLRQAEVNIGVSETISLLMNLIETQELYPHDGLSLAGAFNRLDSVELHAALSSLLAMIISLKNNTDKLNGEISFRDILDAMTMG